MMADKLNFSVSESRTWFDDYSIVHSTIVKLLENASTILKQLSSRLRLRWRRYTFYAYTPEPNRVEVGCEEYFKTEKEAHQAVKEWLPQFYGTDWYFSKNGMDYVKIGDGYGDHILARVYSTL